MVCIYCSGKTSVSNSRSSDGGLTVWRRRVCASCGATNTSLERYEYSTALRIKGSGSLSPFERDKLLISVLGSLSHRKHSLSDAKALTSTIIQRIALENRNGLISADELRSEVLRVLERFDKPAAVHYRAHHL